MKTASVLIIGAGVIGTSIAYHLAKLGCRDVIVLEKNYIGSGSTLIAPLELEDGSHIKPGTVVSQDDTDKFVWKD